LDRFKDTIDKPLASLLNPVGEPYSLVDTDDEKEI
jgi:hypothetical protein